MTKQLDLSQYNVEAQEVATEYLSSLEDLVDTSKPNITMLTMLAEEGCAHTEAIVEVITHHILTVSSFNSF